MLPKKGLKASDYTLIDILFIGYMTAFILLVVLLGRGVENWYLYTAANLAIVLSIIFFIPSARASGNPVLRFISWWYPVLLFTYNYKTIDPFTQVIVAGWMDHQVMAFEKSIFGVECLTLWADGFVSPVLTEVMKFFYFTYYLIIPASAAFLYFRGKRRNYIRFLSTVCLAFYISYLGFILYPVRGPRYELYDRYENDYAVNIREFYGPGVADDVADKESMALKGYFFTGFQDRIMRRFSLHGGCMPSSHVAVAFVCLMLMWLYRRKVFYWYLPTVSILSVSVVYNRYHYISDVFAGIAVGLFALWLTPRLQRGWERRVSGRNSPSETRR